MGGCCAPGTLGPTRSAAMADGISSGETKCGDIKFGDLAELTKEEVVGAIAQMLRAQESTASEKGETTVDVEKLLRVLEIAVEREYGDGLKNGCNEAHHQYGDTAASLRSSMAESATPAYTEAKNALSKTCSKNNTSSSGTGEPCSSKNHGSSEDKQSITFDWVDGVEATIETTLNHVLRGVPCLEVKPSNSRHIVGDETLSNFERIVQPKLIVDPQEKSIQPRAASPSGCQPVVLTEFDDYPRGSSDTNSEEAERDKKTICSIPGTNSYCPTHPVREASFISLGSVQYQPRENQSIPTSCINEELMRVDESDSRVDQTREISPTVGHSIGEPSSSTSATDQGGDMGMNDSYANWLDRHSRELGWKNYMKMRNLNEHEINRKDGPPLPDEESKVGLSGLKPIQRFGNGFESDCSRSWPSQGEAESELHTGDDGRSSSTNLNVAQIGRSRNVESVVDSDTNCSTSSRSQGIREPVSQFSSFPLIGNVESSSKFTPDIKPDDNSYGPLRPIQFPKPTCFGPGNNVEHQQEWGRDNHTDWAIKESGRSYYPSTTIVASPQITSLKNASNYGGAETLRNPLAMVETPSSGSHGDSRCSWLNSRVETPKSVLSGRKSPAASATHTEKVKVCVRMRPFNDHEKVCPLKQLLCVMGTKVIVKEYDRPSLRRSFDSNDTDLLEFRVDCVLDDSYLQSHQMEKKEDSQRRMYESVGSPCLEYALDGYNTTILAYGQGGTGKTYTMMGDGTEQGCGLMPRLAKELMNQLNTEFEGEFEVQVSYLEIYQEKIRDLLAAQKLELQSSRCGSMRGCAGGSFDCSDESTYENSVDCDTKSNASFSLGTPRSWRAERIPSVYFDTPIPKKEYLKIREHPVTGPYVEGLLWKSVTTWQDLEAVMLQGAANRTLAVTPLNKFSSRGHTLFTIKLIRGVRRFVHGCPSAAFSLINLVDLAGTERPPSATRTSLERLDETKHINRSLAQLNDVIVNLSRNKKFISYRGSVLTWLLRDSLGGGNSKLFLIANISPAEQDFQESVTTLRYASKANRIHNIITSPPDQKKQLLVRMKKEIEVLHNLVHDLTKNKITEKVKEELRRMHLPLQCQASEHEPSGMYLEPASLPELFV